MDNENQSIVLLITSNKQRVKNQTIIEYSAIFAKKKHSLDSVEANVFDMVQEHPNCWSCGNVMGYPEYLFTNREREAFQRYGIGKRFSL